MPDGRTPAIFLFVIVEKGVKLGAGRSGRSRARRKNHRNKKEKQR